MMKWLFHNWVLKLVSFVLAVGLWNYALSEEGIEVTRNVPLEIVTENTQISLLKASTAMIKVTLSAPRGLLSDIASEEIKIIHKIGADVKSAGEYSFRLEPREIKLPAPQIRVVRIEPEVVKVTLDELVVQKFSIKPHFTGDPAFGYAVNVEEIQINPNAILIEGPKGEIESLKTAQTESIDLIGRIRSFRRTVSLDLPANVKPLGEDLIDIYIPIKEEYKEKQFEEINVKIIRPFELDEKVTVEPSKISFVLKGSVRQLDKITPENVLSYVDVTGLDKGDHEALLQVVLPEGVTLLDAEQKRVTVSIQKP